MALRRIATLVAEDSPAQALFARVTEEAGRLFGTPTAGVVRYEEGEEGLVVGRWAGEQDSGFALSHARSASQHPPRTHAWHASSASSAR